MRGAAMIFLALTGVVYNLLLRSLGSDTPPWINNTLHVAAPILMVLDFLVDPLRHHLRYVRSLWWTVYPLAYAGYSLVRGPFVDWYPYGFLNPNEDGGWANVIVHIIVISAGFLAVSWVVVRFSNCASPGLQSNRRLTVPPGAARLAHVIRRNGSAHFTPEVTSHESNHLARSLIARASSSRSGRPGFHW